MPPGLTKETQKPFHSLKIKIPLLSALILIVIFSLSSLILIFGSLETAKKSLLERARAFSKLSVIPIGFSYNNFFDSGYLKFREDIQDISASNKDITRIQIIGSGGAILFDTFDIDSPTKTPSAEKVTDPTIVNLISTNETSEIKDLDGNTSQIIEPYFDDFGSKPFSLRYFISYESVFEATNQSILVTLLIALVAFLVAVGSTSLVVHRSILAPLGKIVLSAKEISHGNFSKVIKLDSRDELGDLANSLNQMTEKLKKNIEDLKQLDKLKDEFIILASHNLRTPLTIIKGYTEQLLESKNLGAQERQSLTNLSQNTKVLEETTESLLNLVALEKGSKPLYKEKIDLSEILHKAVRSFSASVAEKKLIFLMELPQTETIKIEADPQKLQQAFSGLIDNAIKFNKVGGKVIVKLEKAKNKILISISDTGIGIANEEKDLIFKKFHRATETLTYNYEGIGLGLYLTKLIIESHQGKIWFDTKLGFGSTFYVELPVKATAT